MPCYEILSYENLSYANNNNHCITKWLAYCLLARIYTCLNDNSAMIDHSKEIITDMMFFYNIGKK